MYHLVDIFLDSLHALFKMPKNNLYTLFFKDVCGWHIPECKTNKYMFVFFVSIPLSTECVDPDNGVPLNGFASPDCGNEDDDDDRSSHASSSDWTPRPQIGMKKVRRP